MKILHTADWHIGKKLEYFNRIDEQNDVLQEIVDIAQKEQVDAVIISGDLFDTYNPASDAVELYYKTLKALSRQGKCAVIALSGNHDSPDRIETVDPLARECGIICMGYPNTHVTQFQLESGVSVNKSESGFIELNLPNSHYPLRIIATPYANEHRLKKALAHEDKEAELREILQKTWRHLAEMYCDDKGVNMLATHLFVIQKGDKSTVEPDDEKPILHVGGAQAIYTENFPEQVQYVALGHLHRKQFIQSEKHPVVYSGSPLSYSFAEANQDKYIMIAELEPGKKATYRDIQLSKGKKLIRIHAHGIDDAVIKLEENKNHLVELTIETDTYLTAKERKILSATHDSIITIIPQVKNSSIEGYTTKTIDLKKSTHDLFVDYFTHTHDCAPGESIMNLFNEVVAENKK
jgi:exonuclease SbcD